MVPSCIVEGSVEVCKPEGPIDWVVRDFAATGISALRFTRLLVVLATGACLRVALRLIWGRLPTMLENVFLVSSLLIRFYSNAIYALSAFTGDILDLLLFCVRLPRPLALAFEILEAFGWEFWAMITLLMTAM